MPTEHERRKAHWNWSEGDVVLSSCVTCVHKHPDAATCDAFPEGIPDVILEGDHRHRTKYPGDGGIRYQPIDGVKA